MYGIGGGTCVKESIMAENNLFTIDLLKGQGIPQRKQKGMLVAVLAALAIPVLIFLFMFARYTTASIMLPLKQKEFNNLVQQASTSKDAKIQSFRLKFIQAKCH